MQIHRDWRGLPKAAQGASIALGNFDGVHLGHVAVLRAAHAARPDRPLAVLTIEPHPREFFRPQDPPFRLMLSPERADALAAQNVAILYELPFDSAFSHLTAGQFVAEVVALAELARGGVADLRLSVVIPNEHFQRKIECCERPGRHHWGSGVRTPEDHNLGVG